MQPFPRQAGFAITSDLPGVDRRLMSPNSGELVEMAMVSDLDAVYQRVRSMLSSSISNESQLRTRRLSHSNKQQVDDSRSVEPG